MTFHEHKLWQSAYKSLMDLYGIIDEIDLSSDETSEQIVGELLESAGEVASTIADGLSRTDRKIATDLMFESVGLIAVTRTRLAVAWGRGVLTDEVFKGLDTIYAQLSESIQKHR